MSTSTEHPTQPTQPTNNMGDDEIKPLPFASDDAAINFAYFYTALTVGHVLDRYIINKRMHVKGFR